MDRLTPIAALQERLDAANAAYDKLQDALIAIEAAIEKGPREKGARNFIDDAETRKIWLTEAANRIGEESDALEMAILYQIPETPRDALHLIIHLHTAIECASGDPKFREARDAAMDALIVYLDDNDIGSPPLTGWHEPMPRHSRRRIQERRGIVEAVQ